MKAILTKRYELFPGTFINPGEAEVLPELYEKLKSGGYLDKANVKQFKLKKNGTNNRNYKRN